jgi:hypothetical protein
MRQKKILPSPKKRPAKARLGKATDTDDRSPAHSVAAIIDEYRDRKARIIRG